MANTGLTSAAICTKLPLVDVYSVYPQRLPPAGTKFCKIQCGIICKYTAQGGSSDSQEPKTQAGQIMALGGSQYFASYSCKCSSLALIV